MKLNDNKLSCTLSDLGIILKSITNAYERIAEDTKKSHSFVLPKSDKALIQKFILDKIQALETKNFICQKEISDLADLESKIRLSVKINNMNSGVEKAMADMKANDVKRQYLKKLESDSRSAMVRAVSGEVAVNVVGKSKEDLLNEFHSLAVIQEQQETSSRSPFFGLNLSTLETTEQWVKEQKSQLEKKRTQLQQKIQQLNHTTNVEIEFTKEELDLIKKFNLI